MYIYNKKNKYIYLIQVKKYWQFHIVILNKIIDIINSV